MGALHFPTQAPLGAPAESDSYETIGQFYSAIATGMRDLCADLGEGEVFRGDPARQVTAGPFHHSGGRLATVKDLASALAALEEIVEQGEGTARGEVWDGDQDIFPGVCCSYRAPLGAARYRTCSVICPFRLGHDVPLKTGTGRFRIWLGG